MEEIKVCNLLQEDPDNCVEEFDCEDCRYYKTLKKKTKEKKNNEAHKITPYQ